MKKKLIILVTVVFVFMSAKCFAQIDDALKFAADSSRQYEFEKNENRYSVYEPNYILSNFGQNDYGQVKFKISFKYDLKLPYRKNKVYFAYTQMAFWDIYKPSAPMRELDFTPTLYYEHRFDRVFRGRKWNFKVDDYKLGYLHQSNGQDGALNRSIFKFTAHADFEFFKKHPVQNRFGLDAVTFTIRTWIWNMVDYDNRYIADYQGRGQLITTLKFNYGYKNKEKPYPLEINDVVIPAKAGLSNELNIKFDPFVASKKIGWFPFLFFQYWHGYGEDLVNYDNRYNYHKPLNVYRVGIQFRVF